MPDFFELLGFDEDVRHTFQYIQSMVDEGIGAQEVYETLVKSGYGKRKQTVLNAYRAARNISLTKPYISSVGNDNLPNPARFGKSIFPQSKKYSYRVRIRGIDELNEEEGEQFINIATDKVITKQQAINTAYFYIDERGEKYGFTPKSAVVTQVTVSPDITQG
jgi:hypothetical protein